MTNFVVKVKEIKEVLAGYKIYLKERNKTLKYDKQGILRKAVIVINLTGEVLKLGIAISTRERPGMYTTVLEDTWNVDLEEVTGEDFSISFSFSLFYNILRGMKTKTCKCILELGECDYFGEYNYFVIQENNKGLEAQFKLQDNRGLYTIEVIKQLRIERG